MIQKILKYLCLISVIGSINISDIHADSLWDRARGPFYGVPKKRIKVGDVVTVYISEATSAVQSASTRTQKDSKIGTALLSNWDQVASLLGNETIRKNLDFELGGMDQYQGSGSTTRRSNVKAIVTCIVTEILDSGNLYILGEHRVKVNNEIETIRISGVIRPADITAKNTVLSSQIAKAELSVNGLGVVGGKQTPGMLTKLFNWLF